MSYTEELRLTDAQTRKLARIAKSLDKLIAEIQQTHPKASLCAGYGGIDVIDTESETKLGRAMCGISGKWESL